MLKAQATNYQSKTLGVVVISNQTSTTNIALAPLPGSVAGNVSSSTSGDPIAGASISLSLNGQVVASTLTDAFGNYLFFNISIGTYTVTAQATNYQSQILGAIVLANQTATVNFSLILQPGSVIGTVSSSLTDNPIRGALVQLDLISFIS